MTKESMKLPYTICFVKSDDKILMLQRKKSPNKGKWNGLGGKLEDQESATDANLREMREESGLDLDEAIDLRFSGIVTWSVEKDGEEPYFGGMYAFVAEYHGQSVMFPPIDTREGRLEWKSIDWVLDRDHGETVDNVPLFLSEMMESRNAKEHNFFYKNGRLVKHTVLEIEEEYHSHI